VTDRAEQERRLIESFVLPERQSRYLELLSKPKRRKDVTSALSHFKHLDVRDAFQIPAASRLASGILALLKSKGAPDSCFVVSEAAEIDGKEVELGEALEFVFGRGIGTFLSCIPGRLAYFEDEDGNFLLERKST
jgi:hypothetical protein